MGSHAGVIYIYCYKRVYAFRIMYYVLRKYLVLLPIAYCLLPVFEGTCTVHPDLNDNSSGAAPTLAPETTTISKAPWLARLMQEDIACKKQEAEGKAYKSWLKTRRALQPTSFEAFINDQADLRPCTNEASPASQPINVETSKLPAHFWLTNDQSVVKPCASGISAVLDADASKAVGECNQQ